LIEVLQLGQVIGSRHITPQYLVDFFASFGEDVGMLEKFIEGKSEETASGLVTSDEEGDHLVAHVLIVETYKDD